MEMTINKPYIDQAALKKIADEVALHPENVPMAIAARVDSLETFSAKKEEAIVKANKAQKDAESVQQMKRHWLKGHSATVEQLQKTAGSLSDAIDSLVEAQKASYDNQEKISQVENFLLALGLMNSTLNRMVIRELEARINNPEQLTQLAREELMAVIAQLKAQEDLYARLEKQKTTLALQEDKIDALVRRVTEENDLIKKSIAEEQRTRENTVTNLQTSLATFHQVVDETQKQTEEKLQKHVRQFESIDAQISKTQEQLQQNNGQQEHREKNMRKNIVALYIISAGLCLLSLFSFIF